MQGLIRETGFYGNPGWKRRCGAIFMNRNTGRVTCENLRTCCRNKRDLSLVVRQSQTRVRATMAVKLQGALDARFLQSTCIEWRSLPARTVPRIACGCDRSFAVRDLDNGESVPRSYHCHPLKATLDEYIEDTSKW